MVYLISVNQFTKMPSARMRAKLEGLEKKVGPSAIVKFVPSLPTNAQGVTFTYQFKGKKFISRAVIYKEEKIKNVQSRCFSISKEVKKNCSPTSQGIFEGLIIFRG